MSTGEFKEEGQPASQSPQDFVCRYFHAGCVFLCVLGDPELLLLYLHLFHGMLFVPVHQKRL
jgi:hypothetical protein